jgi:hypothetical protein
MSKYYYGMRLRGYSIGCQPRDGLDHREDDTKGFRQNGRRYHDILVYNRQLSEKELFAYDLDFIREANE